MDETKNTKYNHIRLLPSKIVDTSSHCVFPLNRNKRIVDTDKRLARTYQQRFLVVAAIMGTSLPDRISYVTSNCNSLSEIRCIFCSSLW